VIDTNNNGVGEYGFLSELAGEPVRSNEAGGVGKTIVRPALLSNSFANVKSLPGVPGGTVTRSGYCFQMFLPDKNGAAVSEALKGGGTGICIDAKKAEVLWCCYAWPSAHGVSGRRTFFINQTGDVLSTNAEVVTYSGDKQPITPTAAFLSTASGLMDCAVAANAVGKDGNRWIVVD